MKRVLFLDHATVLGGAQLVLLNYLKHFDKEAIYTVVASSDKNEYLTENFKKYSNKFYAISFERLKIYSPTAILRFINSLLEVLKIISEEKIDIVCTNTERAMYVGTIASFLSGKKLFWFIRDFHYNKLLFKILSTFPNKIFTVSKSIEDFYDLKSKSNIIYVTSDMHKRLESITLDEVLKFKEKYNLQNKFVVGFIGRLAKWKGIEVLIKASTKIDKQDIVFLIVGENDTENPCELITSRNIVYTGFLSNVEIVLSSLNVFIHPAIEKEPYATSIIEAMMAKVPVVATDLGGTREIVEDNVTGVLIDPSSEDAIVRGILKIYDGPQFGRNIAVKAYEKVMKENKIEDELKLLTKAFYE